MRYSFEDYQKEVGAEFEKFLSENQDHEAIKFLTDSFFFIGFLSENIGSATKNTEMENYLDCLFLQTLDLSRSLIHAQSRLLLTPAALSYRTIFEIYCNLLYIINSSNPKPLAKRFKDFGTYEELSARESISYLENPTDEEIEDLLRDYPEWKSNEAGRRLKIPRNWAPGNKGLKDIATEVGLERAYTESYKLNSKFSHCSSVITKLYKRQGRLYLAAENRIIIHNTVPAMYYSLQIFTVYCNFFGIGYARSDYDKLLEAYNNISRRYVGQKDL